MEVLIYGVCNNSQRTDYEIIRIKVNDPPFC